MSNDSLDLSIFQDAINNISNNEYKDPITNEKIDTPVILPKSNIVLNLSTIEKSFELNGNYDPYASEIVTLEEIMEYTEKSKESMYRIINNNEKCTNKIICKDCLSSEIYNVESKGFQQCMNCGLILANIIDNSPEWRNHTSECSTSNSDNSRCGVNINPYLRKSSLSTLIVADYRLNKIHNWNSMEPDERSFLQVYKLIQDKGKILKIPQTYIDDAICYSHQIHQTKSVINGKERRIITRGKIRTSIWMACIFIACQDGGYILLRNELANAFNLDVKDLTRGIKKFNEIRHIASQQNDNIKMSFQIRVAEDYIETFCTKLQFSKKYIEMIKYVAKKTTDLHITSDVPTSIAPSAILFVCNKYKLPINIDDICKVCNITVPTINKTYILMIPESDKLLPKEITDKYKNDDDSISFENSYTVKFHKLD